VMKLSDLIDAMEQIAPTRQAESWDNVGLLVGDRSQSISRAMLTIDYTAEVAREAEQSKCDVIIAYHPPIFHPLKRILADNLVFDAIRRGIAIYSPHTALDVADGGTNDMLADVLGLKNRSPLRLIEPRATQYKLVTFVPEKDLEKVSQALFEAGAGRIGNYTSCSFRSAGTGTFFGEEGTNPSVGQAGRLEKSEEVRVETVVPIQKIDAIIQALRKSHPYEEPAFDLNQLAAPPNALGQGRIGELDPPVNCDSLLARIKKELKIDNLLVAGPTDRPIKRAAVCAGACSDMLDDAISQKADLYLTGEIRHHDAIKTAAAGMTVVCTLHSNSERAVLKRLEQKLRQKLPGLAIVLSRADRDPFMIR
jgi:dinuclear metal center YbgI/SA1388 family protein